MENGPRAYAHVRARGGFPGTYKNSRNFSNAVIGKAIPSLKAEETDSGTADHLAP